MKKIFLMGSAGVEYEGGIYVCPKNFNALCRIDLKTGITEVIDYFERESATSDLYKKAYIYNNEVWFIPWKAKYIVKVNLSSLKKKYFLPPYHKISLIGKDIERCSYLSSGIYKENFVFLVPTKYDTPIIIDMKTDTIKPYYDVLDVEKQAYGYGTVVNDEFWLSPHTGNRLVRLNLLTEEVKTMEWKYDTLQYRGMQVWDGKIWFAPGTREKSIMYYDISKQQFKYISLGKYYNDAYSYNECFEHNGSLFFLPYQSDKILKLESIGSEYRVGCISFPANNFLGLRRLGNGNSFLVAEENGSYIMKLFADKGLIKCNVSLSTLNRGRLLAYNIKGEAIKEGDYGLDDYINFVRQ